MSMHAKFDFSFTKVDSQTQTVSQTMPFNCLLAIRQKIWKGFSLNIFFHITRNTSHNMKN